MLTLKYISDNKEEIIQKLAKRNFQAEEIIAKVIALDTDRRKTQTEADSAQAQSNTISREIGKLMQQGKRDEAEKAKAQTAELKENIRSLTDKQSQIEQELNELLWQIPNVPHDSVPAGTTAEDNVVDREGGEMPELDDNALPHWELAKKYDLIDFELGVKITGAGFPVYKGKGAQLQRALINFF